MAQTFLRFRQWHMLCVLPLFLLLLAGCTQDVYDMPPTVLINGENYRLANVVYEKLPEGAEYLGELSNCVPLNQMPTENLKANGDLDGHQVYRLDSSRAFCSVYLAYSMALVSRTRLTLICPGYSSSSSIFLAISRASSTIRSSLTSSGLTMMRTSRPAWMA